MTLQTQVDVCLLYYFCYFSSHLQGIDFSRKNSLNLGLIVEVKIIKLYETLLLFRKLQIERRKKIFSS